MVFLLLVVGLFLFLFHGIGFLILNGIFLGLLEGITLLFSGLIGFIVIGLTISWLLVTTHKL